MTRISRGKLRLSREVVDVHDLVRRTVEICRDDIDTAGLALELDLDAAESSARADPARLQQVLWNLIKNAVKFTPRWGSIRVRSRNEGPPSAESPGGSLVVEVIDSGIGIEPAVLPRIFNAFEQGNPEMTQQFGGLGLGLAISRSLAESHGGRLSASSAGRGRGATFRLELPTTRPAREEPMPTMTDHQAAVSPGSLRVLLVEDNADTLRLMTRLFLRRGYQVTPAADLATALEAARERAFDLLISDIGLPDGSGLDLMRQLRSRSAVKGIALSGYGMEDDYRKSREAGFTLHLIKPVDFPALEDALRRVCLAPVEPTIGA
jgi:CheY-like chemotaxis protein